MVLIILLKTVNHLKIILKTSERFKEEKKKYLMMKGTG